MTDKEIQPYVGRPVRLTLADGRIFAGVLRAEGDQGHGHRHYAIVSDALRQGESRPQQIIHGGDQIATIEEASGDPAATL